MMRGYSGFSTKIIENIAFVCSFSVYGGGGWVGGRGNGGKMVVTIMKL